MQAEQQLIQRFGLTYYAMKEGIRSGSITPQQQLEMVDIMASLFRDYVQLHVQNHQAAVAAYQAEKLIDKAKAK